MLNLQADGQIQPREGKALNYRIIGFSFPAAKGSTGYKLEIAEGNCQSEQAFSSGIINTIASSTNKIVAEVPYFGSQYTWRVVYNGTAKKKSPLHHFSTMANEELDSTKIRLRILTPASKYKDGYVFMDSYKALFDMKGKPVWFLPMKPGETSLPRDIKATPFGTITYMMMMDVYEINYDGDTLWKSPVSYQPFDDARITFHHQLSRLKNGNYMVLGNEFVLQKKNTGDDTLLNLEPLRQNNPDQSDTTYRKLVFGTVIEYDKNGKIVWQWKSSSYFNNSDIGARKLPDGTVNANVHENAFYFDEEKKNLYVSFKAISRIVKIKYPEGTVVAAYGDKFAADKPENENEKFCEQHSCNISQEGYLYLYNNNLCHRMKRPEIVVMQEPANPKEEPKVIWKYICDIEPEATYQKQNQQFPTGGNVIELPDQSILCCMGGTYSKTFIVTKDNEILWSALPEKWDEREFQWKPYGQYRASMLTSRKELEILIWAPRNVKQ